MPATIRLKRVGRKKQASFRIVVAEKSTAISAPPIEKIGIYQPRTEPSVIRLDAQRALHWLRSGARPSDTVRSLFQKAGLWEKFHGGVTPEELTEKEIYLGPEGGWKTSSRSKMAEAARQAAAEEAEAEEAAEQAEETEAAAVATEEPEVDEETAPEAEETEPEEAEPAAEQSEPEAEEEEAGEGETDEEEAGEGEEAPVAEAEQETAEDEPAPGDEGGDEGEEEDEEG